MGIQVSPSSSLLNAPELVPAYKDPLADSMSAWTAKF
jgi:hypothetical protein